MKRFLIGYILIVVFGFNLIYSLTYVSMPWEYWTDRILPVALSLVMLYIGYRLVRKKKGKAINKEKPIL